MSVVELTTLGSIELRRSSGSQLLSVVSRPRLVALLARLASCEGYVQRASLASLLWAEYPDERARANLRKAIHELRRALGANAVPGIGDVELALNSAVVRSDVRSFKDAIKRGQHEVAVSLYCGPFLPGFSLDAREFQEWVDAERSALARLAGQAAITAAVTACDSGNYLLASELSSRALEILPYDERALHSLLQATDALGDRAAAIAAFDGFARRLQEDLGVSPSPESQALRDRIRRRTIVRLPVEDRPKEVASRPDQAPEARARGNERRMRTLVPWGRAAALAPVVALSAFVFVLLTDSPLPEPHLVPARVFVDLLENRTGDPEFDYLGTLATDHITSGLTFTGFVDVVTRGTPLLSRHVEPVPTDVPGSTAAARLGAGTMVSGWYWGSGDSLRFDVVLIDVASGSLVASLPTASASRQNLVSALERLRDGVMGSTAAHVDHRLLQWSRHASRPPSLVAYRSFVDGLEAHTVRYDWEAATTFFMQAAEQDSTFVMATLWAALAAYNGGNGRLGDSLIAAIGAQRQEMAPLDRYFFDYLSADDAFRALESARQMIEVAPGSEYLKMAVAAALDVARPHEALQYAQRADPTSGWLWGWGLFWRDWATALHATNQCDEIPELADRARAVLGNVVPVPRPEGDRGPRSRGERLGLDLDLIGFACLADVPRLLEAGQAYARSTNRPEEQLSIAAAHLVMHADQDTDVTPFTQFVQAVLEPRVEDHPTAGQRLAEILAASGDVDSARAVIQRARASQLVPARPQLAFQLALLEVQLGDASSAEALRQEAVEMHRVSGTDPGMGIALVQAHAGQLDSALAWFESRLSRPNRLWTNLEHLPFSLGPLRASPEFRSLVSPRDSAGGA